MCWYEKRFADGRIGFNPRVGLREFKEVFEAFAGTRRGAALFARRNADGSVTAYFTPASAEFAAMIQATQINVPAPEGLTLLSGDPADLRDARIDREGGRRARRE